MEVIWFLWVRNVRNVLSQDMFTSLNKVLSLEGDNLGVLLNKCGA